jgi:hypothetical protein
MLWSEGDKGCELHVRPGRVPRAQRIHPPDRRTRHLRKGCPGTWDGVSPPCESRTARQGVSKSAERREVGVRSSSEEAGNSPRGRCRRTRKDGARGIDGRVAILGCLLRPRCPMRSTHPCFVGVPLVVAGPDLETPSSCRKPTHARLSLAQLATPSSGPGCRIRRSRGRPSCRASRRRRIGAAAGRGGTCRRRVRVVGPRRWRGKCRGR